MKVSLLDRANQLEAEIGQAAKKKDYSEAQSLELDDRLAKLEDEIGSETEERKEKLKEIFTRLRGAVVPAGAVSQGTRAEKEMFAEIRWRDYVSLREAGKDVRPPGTETINDKSGYYTMFNQEDAGWNEKRRQFERTDVENKFTSGEMLTGERLARLWGMVKVNWHPPAEKKGEEAKGGEPGAHPALDLGGMTRALDEIGRGLGSGEDAKHKDAAASLARMFDQINSANLKDLSPDQQKQFGEVAGKLGELKDKVPGAYRSYLYGGTADTLGDAKAAGGDRVAVFYAKLNSDERLRKDPQIERLMKFYEPPAPTAGDKKDEAGSKPEEKKTPEKKEQPPKVEMGWSEFWKQKERAWTSEGQKENRRDNMLLAQAQNALKELWADKDKPEVAELLKNFKELPADPFQREQWVLSAKAYLDSTPKGQEFKSLAEKYAALDQKQKNDPENPDAKAWNAFIAQNRSFVVFQGQAAMYVETVPEGAPVDIRVLGIDPATLPGCDPSKPVAKKRRALYGDKEYFGVEYVAPNGETFFHIEGQYDDDSGSPVTMRMNLTIDPATGKATRRLKSVESDKGGWSQATTEIGEFDNKGRLVKGRRYFADTTANTGAVDLKDIPFEQIAVIDPKDVPADEQNAPKDMQQLVRHINALKKRFPNAKEFVYRASFQNGEDQFPSGVTVETLAPNDKKQLALADRQTMDSDPQTGAIERLYIPLDSLRKSPDGSQLDPQNRRKAIEKYVRDLADRAQELGSTKRTISATYFAEDQYLREKPLAFVGAMEEALKKGDEYAKQYNTEVRTVAYLDRPSQSYVINLMDKDNKVVRQYVAKYNRSNAIYLQGMGNEEYEGITERIEAAKKDLEEKKRLEEEAAKIEREAGADQKEDAGKDARQAKKKAEAAKKALAGAEKELKEFIAAGKSRGDVVDIGEQTVTFSETNLRTGKVNLMKAFGGSNISTEEEFNALKQRLAGADEALKRDFYNPRLREERAKIETAIADFYNDNPSDYDPEFQQQFQGLRQRLAKVNEGLKEDSENRDLWAEKAKIERDMGVLYAYDAQKDPKFSEKQKKFTKYQLGVKFGEREMTFGSEVDPEADDKARADRDELLVVAKQLYNNMKENRPIDPALAKRAAELKIDVGAAAKDLFHLLSESEYYAVTSVQKEVSKEPGQWSSTRRPVAQRREVVFAKNGVGDAVNEAADLDKVGETMVAYVGAGVAKIGYEASRLRESYTGEKSDYTEILHQQMEANLNENPVALAWRRASGDTAAAPGSKYIFNASQEAAKVAFQDPNATTMEKIAYGTLAAGTRVGLSVAKGVATGPAISAGGTLYGAYYQGMAFVGLGEALKNAGGNAVEYFHDLKAEQRTGERTQELFDAGVGALDPVVQIGMAHAMKGVEARRASERSGGPEAPKSMLDTLLAGADRAVGLGPTAGEAYVARMNQQKGAALDIAKAGWREEGRSSAELNKQLALAAQITPEGVAAVEAKKAAAKEGAAPKEGEGGPPRSFMDTPAESSFDHAEKVPGGFMDEGHAAGGAPAKTAKALESAAGQDFQGLTRTGGGARAEMKVPTEAEIAAAKRALDARQAGPAKAGEKPGSWVDEPAKPSFDPTKGSPEKSWVNGEAQPLFGEAQPGREAGTSEPAARAAEPAPQARTAQAPEAPGIGAQVKRGAAAVLPETWAQKLGLAARETGATSPAPVNETAAGADAIIARVRGDGASGTTKALVDRAKAKWNSPESKNAREAQAALDEARKAAEKAPPEEAAAAQERVRQAEERRNEAAEEVQQRYANDAPERVDEVMKLQGKAERIGMELEPPPVPPENVEAAIQDGTLRPGITNFARQPGNVQDCTIRALANALNAKYGKHPAFAKRFPEGITPEQILDLVNPRLADQIRAFGLDRLKTPDFFRDLTQKLSVPEEGLNISAEVAAPERVLSEIAARGRGAMVAIAKFAAGQGLVGHEVYVEGVVEGPGYLGTKIGAKKYVRFLDWHNKAPTYMEVGEFARIMETGGIFLTEGAGGEAAATAARPVMEPAMPVTQGRSALTRTGAGRGEAVEPAVAEPKAAPDRNAQFLKSAEKMTGMGEAQLREEGIALDGFTKFLKDQGTSLEDLRGKGIEEVKLRVKQYREDVIRERQETALPVEQGFVARVNRLGAAGEEPLTREQISDRWSEYVKQRGLEDTQSLRNKVLRELERQTAKRPAEKRGIEESGHEYGTTSEEEVSKKNMGEYWAIMDLSGLGPESKTTEADFVKRVLTDAQPFQTPDRYNEMVKRLPSKRAVVHRTPDGRYEITAFSEATPEGARDLLRGKPGTHQKGSVVDRLFNDYREEHPDFDPFFKFDTTRVRGDQPQRNMFFDELGKFAEKPQGADERRGEEPAAKPAKPEAPKAPAAEPAPAVTGQLARVENFKLDFARNLLGVKKKSERWADRKLLLQAEKFLKDNQKLLRSEDSGLGEGTKKKAAELVKRQGELLKELHDLLLREASVKGEGSQRYETMLKLAESIREEAKLLGMDEKSIAELDSEIGGLRGRLAANAKLPVLSPESLKPGQFLHGSPFPFAAGEQVLARASRNSKHSGDYYEVAETIFEKVRQAQFPDRPPRQKAAYLGRDAGIAGRYGEVYVVEIRPKPGFADEKVTLDTDQESYGMAVTEAGNFFQNGVRDAPAVLEKIKGWDGTEEGLASLPPEDRKIAEKVGRWAEGYWKGGPSSMPELNETLVDTSRADVVIVGKLAKEAPAAEPDLLEDVDLGEPASLR